MRYTGYDEQYEISQFKNRHTKIVAKPKPKPNAESKQSNINTKMDESRIDRTMMHNRTKEQAHVKVNGSL